MTGGGRSKWSQMVRLSTPAIRPSPPSSLESVGKVAQSSITLQWGKMSVNAHCCEFCVRLSSRVVLGGGGGREELLIVVLVTELDCFFAKNPCINHCLYICTSFMLSRIPIGRRWI